MGTDLSTNNTIRRPFDYIRSGSAGRCLNDLYHQIRTDSIVNDWCQHTSDNQLSVKTDLKIRVTKTGRIRIRRFYWSLQRQAQSCNVDFNARTLILEPERTPQWLDFPVDPQLSGALDILNHCEHKQVLHYVPLRRLTVLRHCGKNKLSVVKLKRAGRAQDASLRLRQINACHTPSPISFSLPIDVEPCQHEYTYRQTYCPGITLDELLRRSPAMDLVEQLGSRLASFHMLSASTLPTQDDNDPTDFSEKIRQLTALWPTEASRILNCHDWLQRRGKPETEQRLCHGDLSLENILVDGDQWSLIDLDLAHLGDPIRDIAQLLVQLEANLPGSNNEQWATRKAFLSGYQSVRPESISSRALQWHGCRAELDYLQVAFRKDIGTVRSRAASLVRAERHCRGIGQ